MVILNTTNTNNYNSLTVKYLLEVPRLDLVFCSALDSGRKLHLFLIFNERGKIYARNGLNSTWAEVVDESDYFEIRQLLKGALVNKQVPYFTNNRFSLQGLVG